MAPAHGAGPLEGLTELLLVSEKISFLFSKSQVVFSRHHSAQVLIALLRDESTKDAALFPSPTDGSGPYV